MKNKTKSLLTAFVGIASLSIFLVHNKQNVTNVSILPPTTTNQVVTNTITPIRLTDVRTEQHYKYKLVLTGRLPNAAIDTTYTVLTNDKDLTFEQVAKSQLSSDSKDHLDILVRFDN